MNEQPGEKAIINKEPPSRRAGWPVVAVLFVLLSSLYFATVSGITSSNDGSHYALTRTMVENHAFALMQFDDYAEGNDIAIRDEVLYSDRPPGTAVTATFFYTLAALLPDPLLPLPSRHDAENPRLLYVMLLPVLAGAGTAVLLYCFLRQHGVTMGGAVTAVLMFSLGTAQWKYSTVLFSHALSGFLVLLAIVLAAKLGAGDWGLGTTRPLPSGPQSPNHWLSHLFLGFVLGFSVLVEYSNGLLVVLVGLFVFGRSGWWKRWRATAVPFAIGGLIPAAFLAYYNTVNFGSPLALSYDYAVNYPWAGDFLSTFSWPLLPGLQALLVWGEGGGWCNPTCYNQGLFLLSPIMLLALPGFWFYFRRARRSFWLTTTIFLVYLLLFAKHFTSHGFTGDGRYLIPFLSLLAIPLAYAVDWLLSPQQNSLRLAGMAFLVYGLFFLSLRNILLHIGFSYNYHLDLSQLNSMIASPQNWRYLAETILPNCDNLPLLWLLQAAAGLLLLLGQRFSKGIHHPIISENSE